MSTLYKNLVNFGPLTQEFTVPVWRPFIRQIREIVETRSILGRAAGVAEALVMVWMNR